MNSPSCVRCTFGFFPTMFEDEKSPFGQCRFGPPTIDDGYTRFPEVTQETWCGKFVEKVVVPVDAYLSGSLPTDRR